MATNPAPLIVKMAPPLAPTTLGDTCMMEGAERTSRGRPEDGVDGGEEGEEGDASSVTRMPLVPNPAGMGGVTHCQHTNLLKPLVLIWLGEDAGQSTTVALAVTARVLFCRGVTA